MFKGYKNLPENLCLRGKTKFSLIYSATNENFSIKICGFVVWSDAFYINFGSKADDSSLNFMHEHYWLGLWTSGRKSNTKLFPGLWNWVFFFFFGWWDTSHRPSYTLTHTSAHKHTQQACFWFKLSASYQFLLCWGPLMERTSGAALCSQQAPLDGACMLFKREREWALSCCLSA